MKWHGLLLGSLLSRVEGRKKKGLDGHKNYLFLLISSIKVFCKIAKDREVQRASLHLPFPFHSRKVQAEDFHLQLTLVHLSSHSLRAENDVLLSSQGPCWWEQVNYQDVSHREEQYIPVPLQNRCLELAVARKTGHGQPRLQEQPASTTGEFLPKPGILIPRVSLLDTTQDQEKGSSFCKRFCTEKLGKMAKEIPASQGSCGT